MKTSKLYTEEQVKQMIEKSRETGLTAEYLILTTSSIQLPTDEEIDEKFNDFLQKELEIGISDKATIERIEWYYNTYFKRHKIKGGQDNE